MNEKEEISLDDFYEVEVGDKESLPVDVSDLEELIEKVISKTGLEKETAKTVIMRFFQEIRNSLLDGDEVILNDFGKFYISKYRGYPRFKLSLGFQKKIKK